MFSNTPQNTKPSLLTLANRANNSGSKEQGRENIVDFGDGPRAASEYGQPNASKSASAASSIWNALRERKQSTTRSSDYEEAIASIERDVNSLVSDETMDHQTYSYSDNDAFKPLIDPIIILNAIWRWRWPIVATTFLGGIAGVMIALGTPHVYTAYS